MLAFSRRSSDRRFCFALDLWVRISVTAIFNFYKMHGSFGAEIAPQDDKCADGFELSGFEADLADSAYHVVGGGFAFWDVQDFDRGGLVMGAKY